MTNNNKKRLNQSGTITASQGDQLKNKIGTSHDDDDYDKSNLNKDKIDKDKTNKNQSDVIANRKMKSLAMLNVDILNAEMKKYKFRGWQHNIPQISHFSDFDEYDREGYRKIPAMIAKSPILNGLRVAA
jgi:hypothetical protein